MIDLLQNTDAAGVDRDDVLRNLAVRLREGRLDRRRLLDAATRFGRRSEFDDVQRALAQAAE